MSVLGMISSLIERHLSTSVFLVESLQNLGLGKYMVVVWLDSVYYKFEVDHTNDKCKLLEIIGNRVPECKECVA